jgi:hypothetical protein
MMMPFNCSCRNKNNCERLEFSLAVSYGQKIKPRSYIQNIFCSGFRRFPSENRRFGDYHEVWLYLELFVVYKKIRPKNHLTRNTFIFSRSITSPSQL